MSIPSAFRKVEEEEDKTPGLPAKFTRVLKGKTKELSLKDQVRSIIKQAPGATGPIDFITGGSRETAATRNLPEIGSEMGYKQLMGEGDAAKVAALSSVTFDPVEAIGIIEKSAVDPVSVQSDGKGNVIVNVGDRRGILNKPGFSGIDLLQLVGNAAMFAIPAAKFKGALAVGASEAGIQGLVETGQAMSGGEFDPAEVALAGVSGAAFQKLVNVLADKLPDLMTKGFRPDDNARRIVREEAIKLGIGDELSDSVVDSMLSQVRGSIDPKNIPALAGEMEFGIPLTKGQRSMSDAQLSFEDSARVGTMGEKPQVVMRNFEEGEQIPAVNRALDAQRSALGGPGTSSRADVGATVRGELSAAESAMDDAVKAAYSPELIGDASLDLGGMNALMNATRKAVIGFEFDRTLPETKKTLALLSRTQKALNAPGVKPSTHIRQIEAWRRRLNTAIGAAENNVDKRQLVLMKRGFDDYMDYAVINTLFDGDSNAMSALKNARSLSADYFSKFRARKDRTKSGRAIPDPAGDFMEKVVEANPTDEQIVNMILGVSNLNRVAGVAVVRRMKDALGDDAQALSAIREEAFRRLVKTNNVNNSQVVSGSKSVRAYRDVMEKNASLMRELFTREELGKIGRLFAQIKRTQPDLVRSRENPSGSGVKAVKDLSRWASSLFDGGLLLNMGSNGVEVASGLRKTSKVIDAVRPFQNVRLPRSGIVGTGTATVSAANIGDIEED